ATLFYDTDTQNYIIAFRGTENTGDYIADIFLALAGVAITQIIAMSSFAKDIFETIVIHHQKLSKTNNPNSKEIACKYNSLQSIREYFNTHNINVIVTGHSLGGFLAQSFALTYPNRIKEVYTYNAPGMGGIVASALVIFLRVIRIIWKL
ncbi:lipase family protein, partial [Helicobacter didelphidarum]|uniref:lipase family protein n=1 Tax=Helicobacter didelphidarum TaxID=2040648 RepID=UPI001FE483FC